MLVLLSPAKTLDFDNPLQIGEASFPPFLNEAEKVNRSIKRKSRKALSELQGISYELASLNYSRNQDWNVEHKIGVKQAALAFKGDVYQGLQAWDWSEREMTYARDHLLILSGLYGLLRPSDLIMPYRLEMGTPLKVGRRKDLYAFWSDKIKLYFNQNIDKNRILINLASNEYFKAVRTAGIKNPVLNVEFKEFKGGELKQVTFFMKKARGFLADFILRNQVEEPEGLKSFDSEGYYFDDKISSPDHYVFLR